LSATHVSVLPSSEQSIFYRQLVEFILVEYSFADSADCRLIRVYCLLHLSRSEVNQIIFLFQTYELNKLEATCNELIFVKTFIIIRKFS
jgi:hypothetical protein